jgi:hypothetical protein
LELLGLVLLSLAGVATLAGVLFFLEVVIAFELGLVLVKRDRFTRLA